MAMAAPPDEEFLHQLYRGGELLAAGKVIEAKDYLEKAFTLQPKNEKSQNLLELAYFKLGLFDRAAEIYEALVNENPADPTLRVNLGLVYLKTNALARAMREFETATDLAPDHRKAHNYLGLALAQAGEYARAKEHFTLAGSDAMAEKMLKALAAPPPPVAEVEVKVEEFTPTPEEQAATDEAPLEVMSEEQPPEVYEPPPEVYEEPPSGATALKSREWGSEYGLSTQVSSGGEMRFAEDEGPSAVPPEEPPTLELASAEIEEGSFEAPPATDVTFDAVPTEIFAAPGPEAEGSMEAAAQSAIEQEQVQQEESAPAQQVPGQRMLRLAEAPTSEEGEEPLAEAPVPVPVLVLPHPAAALTAGTARVFQAMQPPPFAPAGAPVLAELSPRLLLADGPLEGPFQVSSEAVALVVQGELLTRLSGLLGYVGALTVAPERMRFRGRSTEKAFGEGVEQMLRLSGTGVAFIKPAEGELFTSIDLDDESAYFHDPVVFAFEEPVMFENGRVPSPVPPDLDLVHLRGKGKVLLRLKGPMRSLEVRADRPVVLPLARLVGWHGAVTPRTVDLGSGQLPAVELSGEGYALFTS